MTERRRVIIYQKSLLPYSETFIKEQALALTCWEPVLAGERLVPGGLALDGLNVKIIRQRGILPQLGSYVHHWLSTPYHPSLEILRDLDADLIHAHFGTSGVDIWPYAKALDLPLVVTLHGFDINIHDEWWQSGKGGLRRRLYPRQLQQLARQPAVQFIAVSESVQAQAIRRGIPPEKISICYTGIDARKFSPGEIPIEQRPRRILYVGRLVENKGVKYLIQALPLIRQHAPDTELVVVGDGPLYKELKKQALALQVPVLFLGVLSHEQIKMQMDTARLLCLPSITARNGESESFGMVLLEAQLSGVPVITSANRKEGEALLDGVTGFKFAANDAEDLARKAVQVLCDDRLAATMSANAATLLRERFNIENCIRDVQDVYSSTLERATEQRRHEKPRSIST